MERLLVGEVLGIWEERVGRRLWLSRAMLTFLTALRKPGMEGDLCGSEGGRVTDEFIVHSVRIYGYLFAIPAQGYTGEADPSLRSGSWVELVCPLHSSNLLVESERRGEARCNLRKGCGTGCCVCHLLKIEWRLKASIEEWSFGFKGGATLEEAS